MYKLLWQLRDPAITRLPTIIPPHLSAGSVLDPNLTLRTALKNVNGVRTILHEVQQLRDRVDHIGSPSSVENRLRTLENGFSRLEGQIDILMRMQQYVARPPSAQAPPSPPGKDLDKA